MDILSIFPLANLASLFILGEKAEYRRLSRPLMGLLAMVWIGWLFWGMWQISWTTMGGGPVENYMQFSRRTALVQEQNVRAFVATGDPSHLANKPLGTIPYSEADELMALLRDPTLLKIMPPACRPPIKLEVTNQNHDTGVAVSEIQELGRFSSWVRSWLNHGVAVLLTGLGLSVLLAGAAIRHRGTPAGGFFTTKSFTEWLIFLAGLVALAWVWWKRNISTG
jgi:hypothetical protein